MSVYAYVSCDKALSGEVAHSGVHGDCPHRIKVCILKIDNPDTYDYVKSRAGEKPAEYRYFSKKDAKDVFEAIVKKKSHVAITEKGDLIVINPMSIPEISGSDSRSKSFRKNLMRLMNNNEDFERASYRNMLAYKRKKANL